MFVLLKNDTKLFVPQLYYCVLTKGRTRHFTTWKCSKEIIPDLKLNIITNAYFYCVFIRLKRLPIYYQGVSSLTLISEAMDLSPYIYKQSLGNIMNKYLQKNPLLLEVCLMSAPCFVIMTDS